MFAYYLASGHEHVHDAVASWWAKLDTAIDLHVGALTEWGVSNNEWARLFPGGMPRGWEGCEGEV